MNEESQIAHVLVDNMFRSFVKNNSKLLDKMNTNQIVPISHFGMCCTEMLKRHPFNVRHVGKTAGGEGPYIMFLDEDMTKIYSYYDVE